jgi:chromosome segregation ATPase
MSNRIPILPLMLLAGSMAHASQLTDAIAKDMASLQTNTATLRNASSAGTEASEHYAHLANDVLPLLQGTKTRYENDVRDYNIENAQVKSAIDAHNANRCMEDACAPAYNAERDRLNAQAVGMQSREGLLNQRRDDLNTMYKNLSTDTDETFQKMKQAKADYNQTLADRKTLTNHLQLLRAESGACKLLLQVQGNGTAEALKLKCGDVQFDGADANLPLPPPDPPSA